MGRPCKSASLLARPHQTPEEVAERIESEKKLKGNDNQLNPPEYLNEAQKSIFNYIVEQLRTSGILGNLDIYILTTAAIAIGRLAEIENEINMDSSKLSDKNLMATKEKYSKDFFRATTELSLSPQSRAKIGNINLASKLNSEDPLLKVLKRK